MLRRWLVIPLCILSLILARNRAHAAMSRSAPQAQYLDGNIDALDALALSSERPLSVWHHNPIYVSFHAFASVQETRTTITGMVALQWQTSWFTAPATVTVQARTLPPERIEHIQQGISVRATAFARACVQAAWRAAGVADDARIDSLSRRARTSGWLPEVRLRVARGVDVQARVENDPYESRFFDTSSGNLWLEGRVTWRLERTVFADEEPSIERIRHDRMEFRWRLAHKTLDALAQWHRARHAWERESNGDQELVRWQVAETESALDVLTLGWFSEHVVESKRPESAAAAKETSH